MNRDGENMEKKRWGGEIGEENGAYCIYLPKKIVPHLTAFKC